VLHETPATPFAGSEWGIRIACGHHMQVMTIFRLTVLKPYPVVQFCHPGPQYVIPAKAGIQETSKNHRRKY